MLDGTGKVRLTDFGLAGAAGEAIRAGTPAYMAPEQLAGSEVTARSDIYSLGLVLYEIFTGQRALDGKNLAELIHKREQSGILPPTAIVKTLDPKIERGDHAVPQAGDRGPPGVGAGRRGGAARRRSARRRACRRRNAVAADGGCRRQHAKRSRLRATLRGRSVDRRVARDRRLRLSARR